MSKYAEEIRATLGGLPKEDSAHWREALDHGIEEALQQRDLPGLAAITHLAINILDGQGRYRDAVDEVDHALEMVRPNHDAVALLWGIKASLLVTQGDLAASRTAANEADEAALAATSLFARRKARMYSMAARCCALDELDLAEADATISWLYRDGEPGEYLFLASWYVPYLFCIGEQKHARPLARAMRLQAESSGHRWRRADAAVFSTAECTLDSGHTPTEHELVPPEAWLPNWRAALLELRTALWNSEWQAAEEWLVQLRSLRDSAKNLDLGDTDAFEACLNAYSEQGSAPTFTPPKQVHQWNLPSVLAGLEAVAFFGTQAEAASSLEWITKQMPSNVATSLEWPTAVRRIRALLALRAGNPRLAKVELEHAVIWAVQSGYPIESALAQTELSELLAHSDIPVRQSTWERLRKTGWQELRSLGLDPVSHAYRIARLVARSAAPRPRLSPREGEVLGLLAAGCTYREAAQRLGLTAGTVQTLVHRAYDKLEVSGKMQALAAARELGIL